MKRLAQFLAVVGLRMLQFFAALTGLVFILLMLLIWRANSAPIIIDTLAPQLGHLLSRERDGITTSIEHARLTWQREDKALRLTMDKISVTDEDGIVIASLPQLALGLNFLAPLHGQLAPLEIYGEDLTISLIGDSSGHLGFGHKQNTPSAAPPADTPQPTPTIDFNILRTTLRDVLQLDSGFFGLGRIGAIRIQNAIVTVQQPNKLEEPLLRLAVEDFTLERRLLGMRLQTALSATMAEGMPARLKLVAEHQRHDHSVNLRLNLLDWNPAQWLGRFGAAAYPISLNSGMTGVIEASFDEQLQADVFSVDIQGGTGDLVAPSLWPNPVAIDQFKITASGSPRDAQYTLTTATLMSAGTELSLQGTILPKDTTRLQIQTKASIRNWPISRVPALWPESVAPNPRAWITKNMSEGVFTALNAASNFTLRHEDWSDLQDLEVNGDLAMQNATIQYLAGMPPVTSVNATATATAEKLDILVAGGKVDRLNLGPAPVLITGLNAGRQDINIKLTGKAPASDVLRLLDQQPLSYAKALGLKPEDFGGTAELDVQFGFPLLKDLPLAAMSIDARAKLKDFASNTLVSGLKITEGDLALAVTPQQLSVTGVATYNGLRLKTDYQRVLSKTVAATPTENQDQVKETAKLTGDLTSADFKALGLDEDLVISGQIPTELHYRRTENGALELKINLNAAKAGLALPMLAWDKPAGQAFQADIVLMKAPKKSATLKQAKIIGQDVNLGLTGNFSGEGFSPRSLRCRPCRLGRNDVDLKLDFAADKLSEIAINGSALHYRDLPRQEAAVPAPATPPEPLNVNINLKRLYFADEHFFAQMRGAARRDASGWAMIDLQAIAEDRVPVSINLTPQADDSRALKIVTDDLGDVLRASDVTDQVHEGRLLIEARSQPATPSRLEGSILLERYRVRKLPFLATLLNAASLTGIADALTGQGINFSRLESGFVWDQEILTLQDLRTAGGALGLNIEGQINFAADQLDLKGTIVPFSFFNSILGEIPLVGDLLTGGKGGGFLAATYTAKGPVNQPEIAVNPISVLAPGILRRIFFQN
jgi:hypothetical protein